MADMMNFPKRWEDFLHDYEFEDARRRRSNMSNEELKTIEEIKQLANIIDVSAKELQTGLRNFLIAKESGCSWFWIPKLATITDDISFLRRKLMELSKMLDE